MRPVLGRTAGPVGATGAVATAGLLGEGSSSLPLVMYARPATRAATSSTRPPLAIFHGKPPLPESTDSAARGVEISSTGSGPGPSGGPPPAGGYDVGFP